VREQAYADAEFDRRTTEAAAVRQRAYTLATHEYNYVLGMADHYWGTDEPAPKYLAALATERRDQAIGADPTDALAEARTAYIEDEATMTAQLRSGTAWAEYSYITQSSSAQSGSVRARHDAGVAFTEADTDARREMNEQIAQLDADYADGESGSLALALYDFDQAGSSPWSTFAYDAAVASDKWFTSLGDPISTSKADATLVLYKGDDTVTPELHGRYAIDAAHEVSSVQAEATRATTLAS